MMAAKDLGDNLMRYWPLIAFLIAQAVAAIIWGVKLEGRVDDGAREDIRQNLRMDHDHAEFRTLINALDINGTRKGQLMDERQSVMVRRVDDMAIRMDRNNEGLAASDGNLSRRIDDLTRRVDALSDALNVHVRESQAERERERERRERERERTR